MKTNSNVKIIGEKVILIPYKKSHVEKYHLWMQSEELLELTASEPLTLEEEYAMQQSWFQDEDKCTFIIADKDILQSTGNEIDSMIGDVNLYLNDPEDDRTAEIEIMIADPAHRSKGKGREALLSMLRYGVEALNIETFVSKIKMKNEQSLKLFSSIGFLKTGSSEIFQEIETKCTANETWKSTLRNKTQAYKLDFY